MYKVQEYVDLELLANGRLLRSFQVRLPSIRGQALPTLAMGRSGYLSRIQRAIDYRRMILVPAPVEEKTWYVVIVDGEDHIACTWFQWVGDRLYGIAMALKAVCNEWEYQNPPRDLERLAFCYIDTSHPDGVIVESIPDTVADASLAALPYVGIPTWGWVATLGAVGIVGAMVLVKARK